MLSGAYSCRVRLARPIRLLRRLVVPTANMEPYAEVPTTLLRACALENTVTVAYANHCGSENGTQFTGLSCITGPAGLDLARPGVNTDAGGRASANREPRTSVFTTGRPSALIPSLATNRSRAQRRYRLCDAPAPYAR